MRGGFNS